MQITGIIGAMDVEVAILRSMMKNARTETVSGIDFIIGSLEGRPSSSHAAAWARSSRPSAPRP